MPQARLMEGTPLARSLRASAQARCDRLKQNAQVTPRLATLLIGDDPASLLYVHVLSRRAREVGVACDLHQLPAGAASAQAAALVERLAVDPDVHAILVQHPVPATVDKRALFERIPLAKDVDGVSSATLGRVLLGLPAWTPCTPRGIMMLITHYNVAIDGLHAVVLGRSPILGRPMASLLINAHATVTLCHSRTRGLADLVRQADLVIAAVGKPRFVPGDWIKEGAVVVDAGYSAGNVGDVDFETASRRAALITPVPGGVGPMTIAVLIDQVVSAAENTVAGLTPRPHAASADDGP